MKKKCLKALLEAETRHTADLLKIIDRFFEINATLPKDIHDGGEDLPLTRPSKPDGVGMEPIDPREVPDPQRQVPVGQRWQDEYN